MKEIWTKKWKTVLIWLCGYLSIAAYALVGGYTIVKTEDDELKQTAKTALIVTLIFTAISAFLAIFNYIGSMADSYYGSSAHSFYTICTSLAGIAKIIVFAVFIVMALVKNKPEEKTQSAPKDSDEE